MNSDIYARQTTDKIARTASAMSVSRITPIFGMYGTENEIRLFSICRVMGTRMFSLIRYATHIATANTKHDSHAS